MDTDTINQAYRTATDKLLTAKLGRYGDKWDVYDDDETYVHNVVEPYEEQGAEDDSYDGAWVAVMIWVPKKDVDFSEGK